MRGIISKLSASWLPRLSGVMDGGSSRKRDEEKTEETATRSNEEKRSSLHDEVSRKRQLVRQTLTSLGPIMATIALGATFGYSAILIPQLKSSFVNESLTKTNDSLLDKKYDDVTISNVEEESWIAASATLLMAPGCWMSGILMERFGRRNSQMMICPVYLIAWLMIGSSKNMATLIAGRVLSGLCIGLQGPLGPVYVAETSEPRLRGILLSGISLAIAVGILISHVLGTWLSWRVTAHLSSAFPFLSLFFCLFVPESPAWLMRKNRINEATNAWKFLRGNNADSELKALRESARISSNGEPIKLFQVLKSPAFLKPLGILNVFFFMAQFSGVNAVTFYCVQMIADFSGPRSTSNAHYATLILDAVRVVASLLACWLTRFCPRRNLTLISGIGTALSLFALSGGLVLDLGMPWLPAIFLFIYVCTVSIGLVPIPWLLCGEIFPVATRGFGSGLSSGFAFVCFFVVVKTSPAMLNGIGIPATFFFYGMITTLGTIFLYFFLPETMNKTLEEIEEYFIKNKSKESQRSIDRQINSHA